MRPSLSFGSGMAADWLCRWKGERI